MDGWTGYATSYQPNGPPPPGHAHDWDGIKLWLNPELVFTAYPAAGDSAGFLVWGGYAYDQGICDGAGNCTFYGIDKYIVHVGCLNGDFLDDGNPNDANMCSDEQSVLDRGWASGEGLMSPTTQSPVSPSIVLNTQDAWDILRADPLAYNPDPNAPSYTLLSNPSQLPYTTSDGRFTQFCWSGTQPNSNPSSPCPNPIQYGVSYYTNYNLTQMNTQQQAQGGSTEVKTKVEVSEQVSVGFLDIFKLTATWTQADTVTHKNTWLDSLSTTQTVANAYTLKADSPNYASSQFAVYQDNQFGTFLMVPFAP